MKNLKYSFLPTPIQKLENLSKIFNANIYCKRDDLTGFAFGGNKTRKLDYIIPEVLSKECDTLVAVGGFQSNFCRVAAAYGAKNGMETHLVLGGKKSPSLDSGNLLLDKMLGSHIHFVESEDWSIWENEAKKLTAHLIKKGKRVYYIPIGGSNVLGAQGYIECMKEIITTGINFDYIIHATSSGGTQSGLILGKYLYGYKGQIIGINVSKEKDILFNEVLDLCENTIKYLHLEKKIKLNPFDIKIDSRYIGKKYAEATVECKEAVKLFARSEGIFLDYVYSGKAASALIDYCRKKSFTKKEKILFIHTGGNIELFA